MGEEKALAYWKMLAVLGSQTGARNVNMLFRYLRGGETYESVGERFGLTRERVRQVIVRAFLVADAAGYPMDEFDEAALGRLRGYRGRRYLSRRQVERQRALNV